ncbi:hypothetical protein M408DRAFT_318882, partial [Serendipita vermifera MAFF 305830]
ATVKEILNTKPDKNAKANASVVPSALRSVGKKLKIGSNISGLQFNPGLVNLGNSCYLNSTLQGLMSTRLLENMVEFSIPADFTGRLFPERSPALRNGRGGKYELSPVSGMELCMTFIRTMEHGWKLRNTTPAKQRISMSARELRARLGSKYDQYLDFQQQDAHEFLRHLLDCMYMEEFDIIKKRQPPVPKRKRGQPPIEPPPEPIPEEQRLVSFIDQLFCGQLASMLICSSCKKVSHTYEPFMDLSLSLRSDEDKESKASRSGLRLQRNRLKAFAQRFTRQAGRPVPRPLSNPPSPRKDNVDLEPPQTVDRRRSLDLLGTRSESEPEEGKSQKAPSNSATHITSPAVSIRAGREPSTQGSTRASGERSRSREPPAVADTKDSKKAKEAAYLRRIMADTNMSKSPLELLKSGLGNGSSSSSNADSIAAAAASWLKLGSVTGPTLMHCLRQFTNVESLDGDNMVGCTRCWKRANPGYVSRRRRGLDTSSSSSSDDSSSDDDEPSVVDSKMTNSTAESQTRSQGNSSNLTTPSDDVEFFSDTTKTSATTQGGESYKGPIPSISTTSPTGLNPPILLNGKHDRNNASKASSSSVTYLTPSSSRHGSIRRPRSPSAGEMADNDSASAKSVSDGSARPSSSSKREVRLKEPSPSIPKSQRVVLRKAFKRYLIAVPPPVLVIHLKRFQQVSRTPVAIFGSLKKIDDFIAFPEYLDLKPFIAPRREEYGLRQSKIKNDKGAYDKQVLYRLYAVVVHIGNMLGGHYIAYTALPSPPAESPVSETSKVAEPPRRWSFQSDQIVRVASLEEVLAAKAYLCFYERISELPASALADGQRKK